MKKKPKATNIFYLCRESDTACRQGTYELRQEPPTPAVDDSLCLWDGEELLTLCTKQFHKAFRGIRIRKNTRTIKRVRITIQEL